MWINTSLSHARRELLRFSSALACRTHIAHVAGPKRRRCERNERQWAEPAGSPLRRGQLHEFIASQLWNHERLARVRIDPAGDRRRRRRLRRGPAQPAHQEFGPVPTPTKVASWGGSSGCFADAELESRPPDHTTTGRHARLSDEAEMRVAPRTAADCSPSWGSR
jgi:hypothetical protein